jgi:hypothetical protein
MLCKTAASVDNGTAGCGNRGVARLDRSVVFIGKRPFGLCHISGFYLLLLSSQGEPGLRTLLSAMGANCAKRYIKATLSSKVSSWLVLNWIQWPVIAIM